MISIILISKKNVIKEFEEQAVASYKLMKKIAVLPGDGIGPEVTQQAVKGIESSGSKYMVMTLNLRRV